MMMRRITLFVAAVAAYNAAWMALASATKLLDQDADWAGTMEVNRYVCPGDDLDDVSFGGSIS